MAKLSTRYVREYFWQTRIRKIFVWIGQIALVVALAFFCALSFGQRVTVTESSMEPALQAGDQVLMNTIVYKVVSPKRGDMIVFRTGTDSNSALHIKRVIGLPGETVQIRDGQVVINGETYLDDVSYGTTVNPGIAGEPVELKKDEFFVLGDNRNSSEDSRHLDIGPVKRENIVGKLWLRYDPKERFGIVG